MLRKIFLLALFSAILTTPASAVMFKIEGLGNFSTPRPNTSTIAYSSVLGIGGGAEFGFMLSSGWSLDLGALYAPRKYKGDVNSGGVARYSAVVTQTSIEIPIILRYWLGSMINFGLGGYYTNYFGNIKQKITLAGATTASDLPTTYADAGQTKSDYGVVVSLGFDFPLGASTGFVIDGRYNYGLKNQVTTGGTATRFSDVQGLVGLRFGGMK